MTRGAAWSGRRAAAQHAELRRKMARLAFIKEQIKQIEKARLAALKQAPRKGTHPMLPMQARVMGIAVETADMLVHEVRSRNLRDQRAVARYGGITGAPDSAGKKGWPGQAMHGVAAA
jgi:transposase